MNDTHCPCGWRLPLGLLAIHTNRIEALLRTKKYPTEADRNPNAVITYQCPSCGQDHLAAHTAEQLSTLTLHKENKPS